MKIYDIKCYRCGSIERDVIATSARKAGKRCNSCGGTMKWLPSFGSVDARAPWYCNQTDQTFSSYRQMEKWCERNGKTVVGMSDYNQNVRGKGCDIEKSVARNDARRREAVRKASYRLRHGYRD